MKYKNKDNTSDSLTGVLLQENDQWVNGIMNNLETEERYYVYGVANADLKLEIVPLTYNKPYQEFDLESDILTIHTIEEDNIINESLECKYTIRNAESIMSYTEEDLLLLEDALEMNRTSLLPEVKKRYKFWHKNIQKLELKH